MPSDGDWGRSQSWEPEFSNCYEPATPIEVDGKVYKSTENYYQSRKFRDAVSIEFICSQESPLKAKFAARKLSDKVKRHHAVVSAHLPERYRSKTSASIHMIPEQIWSEMKESIMFEAAFAKYRQHQRLRRILLSRTGKRKIIEPNKRDEYWGCGKDGVPGHNRLGFVLMDVRRCLALEEEEAFTGRRQRENEETSS